MPGPNRMLLACRIGNRLFWSIWAIQKDSYSRVQLRFFVCFYKNNDIELEFTYYQTFEVYRLVGFFLVCLQECTTIISFGTFCLSFDDI